MPRHSRNFSLKLLPACSFPAPIALNDFPHDRSRYTFLQNRARKGRRWTMQLRAWHQRMASLTCASRNVPALDQGQELAPRQHESKPLTPYVDRPP
jgi:hypothetical protein